MTDYRQRPVYTAYKAPEEVVKGIRCNVYYRNKEGKFRSAGVDGAEDHEDAIISVKEFLLSEGDYWEGPILAAITGGKK